MVRKKLIWQLFPSYLSIALIVPKIVCADSVTTKVNAALLAQAWDWPLLSILPTDITARSVCKVNWARGVSSQQTSAEQNDSTRWVERV